MQGMSVWPLLDELFIKWLSVITEGGFDGSEGLPEHYSSKTKCDYIRWEVVKDI